MWVTRPAPGVEHLLQPCRPCWPYLAPAWSLSMHGHLYDGCAIYHMCPAITNERLQSQVRMCVTRPAPDAVALMAPERELQGEQHHGTHLLSSQSACSLLMPCLVCTLSFGAAGLVYNRSVWPGRCQICRLLIWRRASLVLSDAGLVAECAAILRRCSCNKTTGFMHPAAPSFPLHCVQVTRPTPGRATPIPPHAGRSARQALPCPTLQWLKSVEQGMCC